MITVPEVKHLNDHIFGAMSMISMRNEIPTVNPKNQSEEDVRLNQMVDEYVRMQVQVRGLEMDLSFYRLQADLYRMKLACNETEGITTYDDCRQQVQD